MNDSNKCPWSSGTFGFVGSSGFEDAVVLTYASGGVGGESDVGFEGVVWVEGAEEVAVKVFVGGWIFTVVTFGRCCSLGCGRMNAVTVD